MVANKVYKYSTKNIKGKNFVYYRYKNTKNKKVRVFKDRRMLRMDENKLLIILRVFCLKAQETGNVKLIFNSGIQNTYKRWLEINKYQVTFNIEQQITYMYNEQIAFNIVLAAGAGSIEDYRKICGVEKETDDLFDLFYTVDNN